MQPRSPENSHQRRHQAAPKRYIPVLHACSIQSSIMQALHQAFIFEMLMPQCNTYRRKGSAEQKAVLLYTCCLSTSLHDCKGARSVHNVRVM